MAAQKLSDKGWEASDSLQLPTTDAAVFRNAPVILMCAVRRSKTCRHLGHAARGRESRRRAARRHRLFAEQPDRRREIAVSRADDSTEIRHELFKRDYFVLKSSANSGSRRM